MLPIQGMYSLLRILGSLVVCQIIAISGLEILVLVRGRISSLLELNLSESSKLSESYQVGLLRGCILCFSYRD